MIVFFIYRQGVTAETEILSQATIKTIQNQLIGVAVFTPVPVVAKAAQYVAAPALPGL